eukprot:GFUD01039577.1.p1 GENE.GFUD01039577.1~~GFUD01039577.1.p1  ORF type:complete len:793 (+),score=183.94 GFUD01039577.1:41-2380(+)
MATDILSLRTLLNTCYSLSSQACEIIRSVQARREEKGATALNATLKDKNDSRTYLTEADTAAQELIWKGLRTVFGSELNIVGEEDAIEEEENPENKEEIVYEEALHGYNVPDDLQALVFSDVIVFIDPVDGTREFVEGRLEACQNLIGISYRGRAVAGVIGLPFIRTGSDESAICCGNTKAQIIFGVVGSTDGVHGLPSSMNYNLAKESEMVLGISADLGEKVPALKFVRETILTTSNAKTTRLLKAGACGNKCLKVIQGEADCALMNFGCSLWDTCATEALVVASGGEVSTLFGWKIHHGIRDDQDKETYKNNYGVMVTGKNFQTKQGVTLSAFIKQHIINNKVITDILKQNGVVPHTADENKQLVVDLIRNISDGTVITPEYFNHVIGGDTISSYYSLESDAVRYKQSHACRIIFDTGKTAFLKRIVLRELPSAIEKAKTLPYKLQRDVNANMNESNFLKNPLVTKFNNTENSNAKQGRLQIVKAYDCQALVYADNPIDSKFLLLLEDFSEKNGWHQFAHIDEKYMRSTLQALAKFHAFFWLKNGDRNLSREIEKQLWDVATYWDLEKQPTGQVELLEENFRRLIDEFEIIDDETEKKEIIVKNYGKKLKEIAIDLNSNVHNSLQKQTIIHGDAKCPNFFFKDNGDQTDVGLIDFQWTGAGLCATDVAYAIWTCPAFGVLAKEKELVQYYHSHLVNALQTNFPECEVGAWLPLDQFLQEYQKCFLDLSRCIIGDQWRTVSLNTLRERKGKMVYNAYNKDEDIAKLLIKRVMQSLDQL